MFGNEGYIGNSRSVRSYIAIEDFEVPLSMFKKDLIREFLSTYEKWDEVNDYKLDNIIVINDIHPDDIEFLKQISVSEWKFVAKTCEASSWHHTGKYFKKTDHYSLLQLSIEILKRKDILKDEYKEYKEKCIASQREISENLSFGVIKVQNWGGTRKHPKLLGYLTRAGIVKGDWLYYLDENGKLSKYKKHSNKVEYFKSYNSYEELIKEHKQFKGRKRMFNKIIKEKRL